MSRREPKALASLEAREARTRRREAFAAQFGALAARPASVRPELQHNAERAKHLPAPPVRALRLNLATDGALRVRALPRLRKPVTLARCRRGQLRERRGGESARLYVVSRLSSTTSPELQRHAALGVFAPRLLACSEARRERYACRSCGVSFSSVSHWAGPDQEARLHAERGTAAGDHHARMEQLYLDADEIRAVGVGLDRRSSWCITHNVEQARSLVFVRRAPPRPKVGQDGRDRGGSIR